MAKSQKIGNRFLAHAKQVAHFKAILDRVSFDQPIYDPTDHRDLSALLQRYDAELVKHGVPTNYQLLFVTLKNVITEILAIRPLDLRSCVKMALNRFFIYESSQVKNRYARH